MSCDEFETNWLGSIIVVFITYSSCYLMLYESPCNTQKTRINGLLHFQVGGLFVFFIKIRFI